MIVKEQISNRKRINHIILTPTPHIKSYAALISLNDYYSSLDREILEEMDWRYLFIFKRTWLRHRKDDNGNHTCEYCGRTDLKIGPRKSHPGKNQKSYITLDHIMPLSKGGGKFDTNNFAKACFNCNTKKGDTIINLK